MRREQKVEDYLTEQVEAAGGLCEKHVSPGRRGPPDRLVTWRPAVGMLEGDMDLVETKAPGGKPRKEQLRDHQRRALRRVPVYLIDTKAKVDEYVTWRTRYGFSPTHLHSIEIS